MVEPYCVEPAKSGRSTCKVSKEKIEKGELRFGSFVEIGGHGSYHWRKLSCITSKQIANVERKMGGLTKIGGYDKLNGVQQKKLAKAFEASKKKGEKMDKAKAKVLADKAKAKLAKAKAKEAKAKAKAKAAAKKEKAAAKKGGVKAIKDAKSPAAKKAKATADAAAPAAKRRKVEAAESGPAPPKELQHKFLDAAKRSDFKTVREMLEETPALINVQPAGRWSALHQAAHNGKPIAVKMLLGKGASTTLQNREKKTAHDVAHANCKRLLT